MRILGLVVCLLLFLPSLAPAQSLSDEAQRQVDFAEEELEAGQYQQALRSAESALRLDPSLYRAIFVKALAYEGLGTLRLSESLLIAYLELSQSLVPEPEVTQAMRRVRQKIENPPEPVDDDADDEPEEDEEAEEPTEDTEEPAETSTEPDEGADEPAIKPPTPLAELVDVEGRRSRIAADLGERRCEEAWSGAKHLTLIAPGMQEAHRLLAEAERCAGNVRAAVFAYRQFVALGGSDPTVDKLLPELEAKLARLTVRIRRRSSRHPYPRLTLSAGAEHIEPTTSGRYVRFDDVPSEQTLSLQIAGLGYQLQAQEVAALEPGDEKRMDLSPTYTGTATISLYAHPEELGSTTFEGPNAAVTLPSGSQTSVSAGEVTAVVSNEHGQVAVPLNAKTGSQLVFDPRPWAPASLQISQAPAGAKLRVFVQGERSATQELMVPAADGELDRDSGVYLTSMRFDSLPSGMGGLFLEHPVLGKQSMGFVAEPGQATDLTVAWRSLDGVPQATAAWQEYQSQLKRKARLGTIIPVAVAGTSALVSIISFAAGASELGVGTAVVAGGSIALAIANGQRTKRQQLQADDWDPVGLRER